MLSLKKYVWALVLISDVFIISLGNHSVFAAQDSSNFPFPNFATGEAKYVEGELLVKFKRGVQRDKKTVVSQR